MDLGTNQEVMRIQNNYAAEYGNHAFNLKKAFKETDLKENNNLFNSLKTEAKSNCSHEPSSIFQGRCVSGRNLEVDNSLFSYSSFKKAMDLRTHTRTLEEGKRTIFDDAEHFAKNYCYKLLPITFEQVDESIIQSEHNYSLFSLNSESDREDDCSRTMDYSQIKKKNYKRRKNKIREESDVKELSECEAFGGDGESGVEPSPMLSHQSKRFGTESEQTDFSLSLESENSTTVQPLDLSAVPLVQEEKTDLHLREQPNSIGERGTRENREVNQLDSDKENVNSALNGIRVTITRPDEKENYEPCDLFLNDIARLVPWLIDKDCFEVDILDRTCDRYDEFRKHRLYYIISESTWQLFQRTSERIILTNDQSLGQPVRKPEKDERPSFLVFDQFSLAKCLAEYCQEIGGCFEYTCIEEERNEKCLEQEGGKENEETKEIKEVGGMVEEVNKMLEVTEINKIVKVAEKEPNEAGHKVTFQATDHSEEKIVKAEKATVDVTEPGREVCNKTDETKLKSCDQEVSETRNGIFEQLNAAPLATKTEKTTNKHAKGIKRKKESLMRPESKNSQITTRSKSTSESETSQKNERPVTKKGRRKRGGSTLPQEITPNKRSRSENPENHCRKTRSGKVLKEIKTNKATAKKRESAGLKETEKRTKVIMGEERRVKKKRRSSRSHQATKGKGKQKEKERK